ncbi:MAG: leucine-rich repeat domain-containing protein [Saprospiraceae bacterium]
MPFILLLFALYTIATPIQAKANAPICMCNRTSDSLALVALYQSTNGANWIAPWNLSQPITTWSGVNLDASQCVRALILNNRGIAGTIPSEIGNLSNLRSLFLFGNNFTGAIPSSLGNLTLLEDLLLNDNSFTETIPDIFVDLRELKIISLTNNFFTGNIPSSIGFAFNLVSLDLGTNSLSGSIPSEFGNLYNLTVLNLSNNALSGSIPQELADLTNLQEIYLYSNNLSGTWHPFFSAWNKLKHVWIQDNKFEGTVPDWRNAPLISLKIEYNNFTNIPNYSTVTTWGLSAPYGLNIIGNRFTFEDLIPLKNFPPRVFYTFRNQQAVQTDSLIFIPIGGNYTIRLNVDDTIVNNSYRWLKDSTQILVNKNTFSISNAQPIDEGYYYGSITNPEISNFEIKIVPIRVVITKENCTGSPGNQCSSSLLFCNNADLNNYCGTLGLVDSTFLNDSLSFCIPSRKFENSKWFSFIASSDSFIIEIIPNDCSEVSVGNQKYSGIEAGIFPTCELGLGKSLYCDFSQNDAGFQIGGGGFIKGNQYYLVLDGNRGSICDYVIRLVKGTNTYKLTEPAQIEGQKIICQDTFPQLYTSKRNIEAENYLWFLNDSLVSNTNDTFVQFKNLPLGSYNLKLRISNACDTSATVNYTFNVLPSLSTSTPFVLSENNDSSYRVNFSLLGGTPVYKLISGSGSLDSLRGFFTSSSNICQSSYTYKFEDRKGCKTEVNGIENCRCLSYAGRYNLDDTINICEGQIFKMPQPSDALIDSIDLFTFFISKSDTYQISTILKINSNGSFTYDPQLFRFNTVYYLRFATSKPDYRNQFNFNHPCLSLSDIKKIIFRQRPIVSAGQDDTSCDLQSELKGFGNYSSGIWKLKSGPGTAIIDSIENDISKITVDTQGIYTFIREGSNQYCTHKDEVTLTFKDTLRPLISGSISLCGKGVTKLSIPDTYTKFVWSNGDSTLSTTIDTIGTYCVNVVDSDGCLGYSCIDIIDSNPPELLLIGNTTLCAGDKDSLFTNQIFNSYKWNDSTSTPSIIIDKSGNYCLTVTDQLGCTAVACKNVTKSDSIIHVLKDTGCTGEIIVIAGLEFTFPGNYRTTFINASSSGCDSILQIDLIVNGVYIQDSSIKSDNGNNNGSISITPNGGKKPYRFKWTNNATSSSIFNLKFGTYSVTVTDANNCDYLYSFIVPFNTSIYSNESKEEISFYPNPNKEGNLVYCKATGDLLEWNLKIRDFSGKLIEQFDLKFSDNNTPQPIPFKPSSGIYFIECYNDKGIISSQKIIIQ